MITFMKQNGRVVAMKVDGDFPKVHEVVQTAIKLTNVSLDEDLTVLDETICQDHGLGETEVLEITWTTNESC